MPDKPSPLGDPLELARALIRCPSVTPDDAGALNVLQTALLSLGFTCHRLPFKAAATPDIDNLYARLGNGAPHFCFAGHSDVVPPGNLASWTVDPFAAIVEKDILYGRGAADMKGAIACFVAAVARVLPEFGGKLPGSVSLLITGDEEGVAINGTAKMLGWLEAQGEKLDHSLVGEPTNARKLGDMAKIGRRGSINGLLTVKGAAGHAAYPHLADNPIPRLIRMLSALIADELDEGTAHFQPSNLEITSVDVGNAATNVIPAEATARFNIRFNDLYTAETLKSWVRDKCDGVGGAYSLEFFVSGEAFLTPPGFLSGLVGGAVERVLGTKAELSTSGGTSDARFIKDHCPVIEFGLVGQTMHKADERVSLQDLHDLTAVYAEILRGYFS
jgi:succinyl-diaminopimelate desuccinylase